MWVGRIAIDDYSSYNLSVFTEKLSHKRTHLLLYNQGINNPGNQVTLGQ